MQIIPQHLLQPLQFLFHNTRSVSFLFSNNDHETLKSLYKIMASGHVSAFFISLFRLTLFKALLLHDELECSLALTHIVPIYTIK